MCSGPNWQYVRGLAAAGGSSAMRSAMSARIGASPCLLSANGKTAARSTNASAMTTGAAASAARRADVDAGLRVTAPTSAARTRGSAASISSSETAPTEMRNQPLSSSRPKAWNGTTAKPAASSRSLRVASFVRPGQREADRQIDRALRRDHLDGQPLAAHRREAGRERVEPLAHARRASSSW